MSTNHFGEVVETLRKEGLYPEIPIVQSAATETKIVVDGKERGIWPLVNWMGLLASLH